jgi:hypothetical protein
MSWKERISFYKDGGSSNSKATEDMVARRILRGLGATERLLPDLEKNHEITPDYNIPLWNRVYTLINAISNGKVGGQSDLATVLIEAKECKIMSNGEPDFLKDEESFKQLCTIASRYTHGITLFARVSGTKDVFAYSILNQGVELPDWILNPKSTYLYKNKKHMLWVRDTEDLIRDMAISYRWEI